MVGFSNHARRLRMQLDRSAGRRTQEIVEAEAVSHFPCPVCDAIPGTPCRMGWGLFKMTKTTSHPERVAVEILIYGGVKDNRGGDVEAKSLNPYEAMIIAAENMDKSS